MDPESQHTPDEAVKNTGDNTPKPQEAANPKQKGLPQTQDELDAIVTSRLDRDRKERQDEADRKATEEQGNYKKLYQELEPKHKQLEAESQTLSTRITTLSKFVSDRIEAETKDWPALATLSKPAADAPIEDMVAWADKYRPEIEKLQQPTTNPAPAPSNFAPTNNGSSSSEVKSDQELLYRRGW